MVGPAKRCGDLARYRPTYALNRGSHSSRPAVSVRLKVHLGTGAAQVVI